MKTLRKLTIVIVLVCLICTVASFGEEPTKAKPELKFEISSEKYNIKSESVRRLGYGRSRSGGGRSGRSSEYFNEEEKGGYGGGGRNGGATETSNIDKPEKIKPTHVAHTGGSNQLFVLSCFEPDALLATTSGKKMSDLQKKFVKQGSACEVNCVRRRSHSILKKDYLKYARLFAVSEDDAKKMASAFIESWQNNMGAEVQKLLEKKQDFEKKTAELRKRHDEKRKEYDELKKTLKEKSSKGFYSLDGAISPNPEAKDEVRQAVRELYLKLNSANIEIEVIKARLSAATVYQARENANPTVQAKLEEILCEQTIELAGALERQAGITKTLQQEEEIYRLYEQLRIAVIEVRKCQSRANVAERDLKLAREEFDNIDSSYPRVADNKVVICPVGF